MKTAGLFEDYLVLGCLELLIIVVFVDVLRILVIHLESVVTLMILDKELILVVTAGTRFPGRFRVGFFDLAAVDSLSGSRSLGLVSSRLFGWCLSW